MTEIARLKLYHYPASRSARVKWMLHEVLGDDFDVETVQLYEGAQYSDAYRKKNPNHAVPTLEITGGDGSTRHMFESSAIVTWLADAHPDKALAPPPHPLGFARSDYLQMIHFGGSWMDMMLWQIRIHEHVLPTDERDPRTIERYRNKFATEAEPQIGARLGSAPHVCGEAFSAADCIIGHNVMWAKAYGLCKDGVFGQYLSRISKRPAFVAAFADAHLFKPQPPAESTLARLFTG